jgi:hypothetical protein
MIEKSDVSCAFYMRCEQVADRVVHVTLPSVVSGLRAKRSCAGFCVGG